jgi:anti-anti-sigma factor
VQLSLDGSLLLRGELDIATIQDLQDAVDLIMVPSRPIVMNLAELTFLDSSAIHLFIRTCSESGHPVVLQGASLAIRRTLHLGNGRREPEAWMFDGDGSSPATA